MRLVDFGGELFSLYLIIKGFSFVVLNIGEESAVMREMMCFTRGERKRRAPGPYSAEI